MLKQIEFNNTITLADRWPRCFMKNRKSSFGGKYISAQFISGPSVPVKGSEPPEESAGGDPEACGGRGVRRDPSGKFVSLCSLVLKSVLFHLGLYS